MTEGIMLRSSKLGRVWYAVLMLVTGAACAADDPSTAVLGNWLTEPKDGIIQITRSVAGLYEGRIVGGNQPGKLDSNNPDVAKRALPLRGQVILHDLKYDGDGKWVDGTIYDPQGGKTYRCKLELRGDGTLKVRGFIGISLLGKTQLWTRYAGTAMDLPK
jgi:uncharacterized protein (DUF2147 family)